MLHSVSPQYFIDSKTKIRQQRVSSFSAIACHNPRTWIFSSRLAGEKKKHLLSKLFHLREVHWFHESESSLTWCKIYSSIPPDSSLIQSMLIQHMECSEGAINVVIVCCEEKQRERSQDTRNKTQYHSRDKRSRTWGTCFRVHAYCCWRHRFD